MCKREYPKHIIYIKSRKWKQYLWTWRQSVVPNDAPRDFGPEVAFGTKFQIPVARQWGREVSAPIDHMWQVPFIHSIHFIITSDFHTYIKMCRFFLPSGTDKYVLLWWVFNNCACAFQKKWAQGRERLFCNFDSHVVRASGNGVFPSALIAKKEKRSATTSCLPIKSLSLLLCVHRKTNWKQKAVKSNDKKARTT